MLVMSACETNLATAKKTTKIMIPVPTSLYTYIYIQININKLIIIHSNLSVREPLRDRVCIGLRVADAAPLFPITPPSET